MKKYCKGCKHRVACKGTVKACRHFNELDIKNLSLNFRTNDIQERKDEYEVSIDTTWVMFPSGAVGQRLEVFYKKKDAEYGEMYEIGTAVISKGVFRIIQW